MSKPKFVYVSICGGWPKVLSSLKSWLETGRGLEPSRSDQDRKRHATAEVRA